MIETENLTDLFFRFGFLFLLNFNVLHPFVEAFLADMMAIMLMPRQGIFAQMRVGDRIVCSTLAPSGTGNATFLYGHNKGGSIRMNRLGSGYRQKVAKFPRLPRCNLRLFYQN